MRVNVTVLPIIVAAVLMGAAFVTRSEPAPEPARSYFATLVGRELVWHQSKPAEPLMAVPSVEASFNAVIPRIATQLEGDLSPIGAVFTEQDFPAWSPKAPSKTPESLNTPQVVARPLPQISSVPVSGDAYENMRGWLRAANAPEEWVADLVAIGWCESRGNPLAWNTDNEDSRGAWQLWAGWFPAAGFPLELWTDPVVNAATAVYVRSERGRYGGKGGWSCADHLGIY